MCCLKLLLNRLALLLVIVVRISETRWSRSGELAGWPRQRRYLPFPDMHRGGAPIACSVIADRSVLELASTVLLDLVAMADVFTLLTLPQTSKAFSELSLQPQGALSTRDSSRSASPPRKIARLDYASDTHSASASSSRAALSEPAEKRGSSVLQVIGHPSEFDSFIECQEIAHREVQSSLPLPL